MMKPKLKILDVSASIGCNLSCKGCNHFSNYFAAGSKINTDELLNDLNKIASQGHRSIMFFLIQRTDVFEWDLACDIDRDYCLAFSRAEKNGMEAMAYTAHISTSSIEIGVEIFRRQG